MESEGLLTDIINLVVNEIQKTQPNKNINIQQYQEKVSQLIQSAKTKLDQSSLNRIDKYLKSNHIMSKIISVCIANIQLIIQDGKIDLNDTSYFLDIITGIYDQINTINQDNVTLKISSNDLIELAALLLKVSLVFLIEDENCLSSALKITNSTISLAKLTMASTKGGSKSCCFS